MQINVLDLSTPHYQRLLRNFDYDIYHHSDYILAEANRVNAQAEAISISNGSKHFLLPNLLRKCPKHLCESISDRPLYDAVSPYGYPGLLLSCEAQNEPSIVQDSLDLLVKIFQSRDICSAFIRLHPILNADVQKNLGGVTIHPGGMTVSIDLSLSEHEQWHQIQSSRRTRVNRCGRNGFHSKILPLDQRSRFVILRPLWHSRIGLTQWTQILPRFHLCLHHPVPIETIRS